MQPAEVRKLENLPFVEGSDRLMVNSTIVPLDEAGDPAPGLTVDELRGVMGRLGRPGTVADVDVVHLVGGLDPVKAALVRSVVGASESVDDLKSDLKRFVGGPQ
jgi:hypothetical protein